MAGASKRRRSCSRVVTKRRRMNPIKSSLGIPYAKFHRLAWIDNWAFSTISANGFWRNYQPQLATLAGVAEYTQLFDTYKISKVKITFLPNYLGVDAQRSGGGTPDVWNQQFYMAVGVQKGVIETATGTYGNGSFNTFTQNYNDIKIVPFNKPVSVTYKPQILDTVSNGTSLIPCPWISTNSTDVAQLGVGAFLFDNNFNATNLSTLSANVHVEFWFDCKGSR